MSWYPAPLPDQTGRKFLVTGANAGLGFFTTARLVGAGAQVVMTGRSRERLQTAADVINARVAQGVRAGEAGGTATTLVIDQSSLESVAEGAAEAASLAGGVPFDGFVLNAGLVHTPARRELSVDGNELVLATNVLGHFALLARLLGRLGADGRVVSLGSLSTQLSTFRVDDLQLERGYDLWRAYAQSKIASQSIAFELDRRLRAAGSSVLSVVAHPGYSISGRTPFVPGVNEPSRGSRFADQLQGLWAQGKHRGAEPVLHALTARDVEGGQFWGPRFRTKGEPVLANATRVSRDAGIGARVWAVAEQATGVPFDVAAIAPR
ncbi:SDR family NAD(P)-dependent oxidoreductase [Agromyces silvae]|uniref:SDR family NAD(P)-dependent oxidoreductase n=1 Tax=Agromyces silvae TaxID=3388266 RepID=UPI00280A93FD|nr:SDR family NAD(P)-dependent oxidoreductase [Agromyces protaetiae]